MKLDIVGPNLEINSSGKEHFFGISKEHEAIVLDILRSKMYKNPVESICREITSNSRDAHREVGKHDVPVEIEVTSDHLLMNSSDEVIIFRDFGPGIKPEDIPAVYVLMGESTKRHTNELTGGFGIGGKTPFAYSDFFQINSHYGGERRVWIAAVDESKRGKMFEFAEMRSSTDLTGVEVIVPIKRRDIEQFWKATIRSCWLWETKPHFKGFKKNISYTAHPNDRWPEYDVLYRGDRCDVISFTANKALAKVFPVTAVVDEIPYQIDLNQLDVDFEVKGYGNSLLLHFDTGEISLSSTREEIHYDKHTKKVLTERVNAIWNEAQKIKKERIDSFDTFYDAFIGKSAVKDHPLFNVFVDSDTITWNGDTIKNSFSLDAHKVYSVLKRSEIEFENLGDRTRIDPSDLFSHNNLFYLDGRRYKPREATAFKNLGRKNDHIDDHTLPCILVIKPRKYYQSYRSDWENEEEFEKFQAEEKEKLERCFNIQEYQELETDAEYRKRRRSKKKNNDNNTVEVYCRYIDWSEDVHYTGPHNFRKRALQGWHLSKKRDRYKYTIRFDNDTLEYSDPLPSDHLNSTVKFDDEKIYYVIVDTIRFGRMGMDDQKKVWKAVCMGWYTNRNVLFLSERYSKYFEADVNSDKFISFEDAWFRYQDDIENLWRAHYIKSKGLKLEMYSQFNNLHSDYDEVMNYLLNIPDNVDEYYHGDYIDTKLFADDPFIDKMTTAINQLKEDYKLLPAILKGLNDRYSKVNISPEQRRHIEIYIESINKLRKQDA